MTTTDWLAQQQAAHPQDTRLADIRQALSPVKMLGGEKVLLWAADVRWLLDQLDAKDAEIARVIEQSARLIAEVRDAYRAATQTTTDSAADRPEWQERLEVAAQALVEMAAECDALRAENEGLRDSLGLPPGDGTDYSRHPDQAGLILALEIDRDSWRERAEKAEKTEKRLRQLIDVNNEIMKMGA